MEDSPTVLIPTLPHDVIIEILTWLPVKPLLKFRCVCKSWRTLISSQQFVKSHLENSKLDPNFTTHRLIVSRCRKFKQCSVNSVLYEPVSEAFDLSCPVETEGFRGEMVGLCNGLICLAIEAGEGGFILWNPSTRIWKKLPDFIVKENHRWFFSSSFGFGYDKLSDDYNVVGFYGNFQDEDDMSKVIVQVYSLRNDKWKSIKNFAKANWEYLSNATFVNGKLYWVASGDGDVDGVCFWDIVSFDLEEEEEEEDEIVQMPSYVKKNCHYGTLGVSGGSLLVLCKHLSNAEAQVWIMDCCNKNWTKVITIPLFNYYLECAIITPLYVQHGQILLCFDLQTLAIFDAKDCSIRYPEVRNAVNLFAKGTYHEGLVSLSPLGY